MRPCSLRLPGCRNDPAETVFAHAPSVDNGMGIKTAKDFWGAFACSHCHDVMDKRTDEYDITLSMLLGRWLAGIYETQKTLMDEGLMSYDDS
jgi:hypothetical protein